MAEGDVVYAIYAIGGTSGTSRDMAMLTSGYTELLDAEITSPISVNLGVFRKVMGASPDSDAQFEGNGTAGEGVACCVVALTGVDTINPEDTAITSDSAPNDAVPDPPSITTVTNGAWVIAIGASSEADIPTAPTDYENLVEDQNAAGVDINIMAATRLITSAGAENPGVFGGIVGSAADAWYAATVAVRPIVAFPALTAWIVA